VITGSTARPASAPAVAVSKTWSLGERDGRQCLLTPAGKPFMILGLSHASGAWQAGGGKLTPEEKDQRLATLKQDLRDLHFNAVGYVREVVSEFAYILGYYKCQYGNAVLASGQLKQGLRAQDGKLYGDWAQSLARIHQSLLANFEKEGRFTP